MTDAATPGPWSVSEVRTVEGEYMVVGGEGQGFGLIACCPVKTDAELIVRLHGSDVRSADDIHLEIERLRGENDKLRHQLARALSPVGWGDAPAPSAACTCGGDMAHDYHQEWCPAVPSADRGSK